ncbi:DUF3179 domain-containing protein [Candidatus Woesearchaeota archaeon]|nr:DUF3179 domain-containing protein [Candidatus Woesearchaeota archaeon]
MIFKNILGIFALLAVVFITGCSHINVTKTEIGLTPQQQEQGVQVTSDGTKYIIDPNKIQGGGPGKGGIGVDRGIPALAEKNIKFVSVEEADEWIEDNELVLALVYKNEKRVYPLQILVWHEIANDVVAGDSLLITYCPLCGSGIAYERQVKIDGKKAETRFGTSGKLYNSNLVMYDEETDTYWQQIDGKAIVGELTGQELKEISIDTVSWGTWKAAHQDSEVLSQDTGMKRNYGRDPYGNYYEDSFLIFPVENEDEDNKIHPKTQIVGIEINGKYKAYIRDELKKGKVIKDNLAGTNIKMEKLEDDRIVIINEDTNQEIIKEEDMWFAWYAFHPETELYQK